MSETKAKTRRFCFVLPDRLHTRLVSASLREGMNCSLFVRRALKAAIDQSEKSESTA